MALSAWICRPGKARRSPTAPRGIEPELIERQQIRSGVGRALLAHAVAEARQLGAERLTILADPNAAGFYERNGAARIGEVPSDAVPGRPGLPGRASCAMWSSRPKFLASALLRDVTMFQAARPGLRRKKRDWAFRQPLGARGWWLRAVRPRRARRRAPVGSSSESGANLTPRQVEFAQTRATGEEYSQTEQDIRANKRNAKLKAKHSRQRARATA
jgi:Acetyltransferase (GNAT) domain